ncbi:hypothetical protein CF319_g9262 [Tilletia indica]|uniref:Uncharacterized protein n=1 Tax=Tilletia indica TaxID=43049 RepID=A0A8T8SBL8_9BASI|nr:hypothetical protein CF319_g9262 [Tilletia indica]KAE8236515.1 hypothetical protein A4X13_0g9129 [Tilletia indica]
MPTVLAVSLAIGAEQSAKRKALGTHTALIENIPVVTIPYSDKTSTVQTNKITIDPETGKLSSKGQAHQRRDHPRLRVSAWNREPIPSIRGVGTRRSSVETRDSTVSSTEVALALFASALGMSRNKLLDTSSHSIKEKEDVRVPSVKIASSTPAAYVERVSLRRPTVLSSACRVSTAQQPVIPTAPTTSPGSTS